MFDKLRLKDVLVDYKLNFVSNEWGNEKYKQESELWLLTGFRIRARSKEWHFQSQKSR